MNNYELPATFTYTRNNKIKSIIVDFDETQISIDQEFIKELQKYTSISENSYDIIYIVARAILLKQENFAVKNSVKRYQFGNQKNFAENFCKSLFKITKKVSIEMLVLFFSEAKVNDLNTFITNPELIDYYI